MSFGSKIERKKKQNFNSLFSLFRADELFEWENALPAQFTHFFRVITWTRIFFFQFFHRERYFTDFLRPVKRNHPLYPIPDFLRDFFRALFLREKKLENNKDFPIDWYGQKICRLFHPTNSSIFCVFRTPTSMVSLNFYLTKIRVFLFSNFHSRDLN